MAFSLYYILLLANTKEECLARKMRDGRVTFGILGFKRYCENNDGVYYPAKFVFEKVESFY